MRARGVKPLDFAILHILPSHLPAFVPIIVARHGRLTLQADNGDVEMSMLKMLQQLPSYLWANLGHCPICTRKAFLTAAGAWMAMALSAGLGEPSWFVSLLETGAVGLTALWVAHLAAFAKRAEVVTRGAGPDLVRRAVIPTFARTLAAAAIASTLPRVALAGPTTIQCSCTGGKTTSGCCPTEDGNLCICTDPQIRKFSADKVPFFMGVAASGSKSDTSNPSGAACRSTLAPALL